MDEIDFDLPYELLSNDFFKSNEIPLHTSRGCPYRCGFCYNSTFHKRKYRYKSADRVISEMEYLIKKYKVSRFSFGYEDEFFVNIERAYKILKFINNKGLKISGLSCRFDTFDRAYNKFGSDFVNVLKKSVDGYLAFGAESGSQRLLDEIIQKDITVEQIFRTIEVLKKAGIVHRINFMFCFPTEKQDDLEATFDVIDRISHNNSLLVIRFNTLTPYPRTPIYELLKRGYAFKPPSSLEEWGNFCLPFTLLSYVTWVPRKYAKMCRNVALLSFSPFYKVFKSYTMYKEFIYKLKTLYSAGYLAYIMAKLQRYRYKNRLFKFMIESLIYYNLLIIWEFFQNYVFKNTFLKLDTTN